MDFTKADVNVDQQLRKRQKHGLLYRLIRGVIVCLVVVVVVVACLPMLLSLGAVRSAVVKTVNQALAPQYIEIADWSFGWFSQQSISEITYRNAEAGIEAKVAKVELNSLASLASLNVVATVDSPFVRYTPPKDVSGVSRGSQSVGVEGDVTAARSDKSEGTSDALTSSPRGSGTEQVVSLPDFSASIQVNNARVEVAGVDDPVVRSASFTLDVPNKNEAMLITAKARFLAAEQDQLVMRTKTASLVQLVEKKDFSSIASLDVALQGIDAADFNPIVKQFAPDVILPAGAISLQVAAPTDVLKDLSVALDSPWVTVKSSSAMASDLSQAQVSMALSADLARVVKDFATVLKLDADLAVRSGRVSLASKCTYAADTVDAEVELQSQSMDLMYKGQPFEFAPTASFAVKVPLKDLQATQLTKLAVKLPGVNIEGAGSLAKAELLALCQVEKLFASVKPFVPTLPESQATLAAKVTFDGVVGEATVKVTDRGMSHGAVVRGSVMRNQAGKVKAIDKVAVKIDVADAFTLNMGVRSFDLETLTLEGGLWEGTLDLDAAWRAAQPYLTAEQKQLLASCKGKVFLNATAAGSLKNTLKVKTMAAVQNTDVRTAAWSIRETNLLSFASDLMYVSNPAAVIVQGLTLKTPAAALDIPELNLPLAGENPIARLSTTIKGSIVPNYFVDTWRIYKEGEMPTRFQGQVSLQVVAEPTADARFPKLMVAMASENLALLAPNAEPLALPIELKAHVLSPDTETLTLKTLVFTSPFAVMNAQGGITKFSTDQQLDLTGDLTVDFDAICTLPQLQALKDAFVIKGRNTHPFECHAPLGNGANILSFAKASGEVSFDSMMVPGLDIGEGRCTFKLAEGLLAIDGKIPVNEGALNLTPRINLGVTPYVVTFPENSAVLDRVALTTKLANLFLGKINPFFVSAVKPEGTLNLTLNTFEMPLNADPVGALTTTLTASLDGFALAPSGNIATILSFFPKAEGQRVTLEDNAFKCAIKDGLLTSDPISFRVGNFRMSCAGTTHLSTQAINYTATIPLNERLVGDNLYKNLDQKSVTIPITGTTSHPKIETQALKDFVANAAKSAAKKTMSDQIQKQLEKRANKKKKDGDASAKDKAISEGLNALKGLF